MKDERNHHGTVDKSFSEQQISNVDTNYILCEKDWICTHSGIGSYSRWQANGRQMAVRQNTGEFGFFKKSLYIERFEFLLHLTKVQHNYSIKNAFQVFFRVKSIVKLVV